MVAINQRIPNFIGGVSQQPDKVKYPGQLRVCDNAVPDITFGLTKRPPAEFLSKLANANDTGEWFEILRDNDEKFLCQITPANFASDPIRIWNLTEITVNTATDFYDIVPKPGGGNYGNGEVIPIGTAMTVSEGTTGSFDYLEGATDPLGMMSLQDFTLFANPQKTVRSSTTTSDAVTGANNAIVEAGKYAFASVDTLAYNTEYCIYASDTAPTPNKYFRVTGLSVQHYDSDGDDDDDWHEGGVNRTAGETTNSSLLEGSSYTKNHGNGLSDTQDHGKYNGMLVWNMEAGGPNMWSSTRINGDVTLYGSAHDQARTVGGKKVPTIKMASISGSRDALGNTPVFAPGDTVWINFNSRKGTDSPGNTITYNQDGEYVCLPGTDSSTVYVRALAEPSGGASGSDSPSESTIRHVTEDITGVITVNSTNFQDSREHIYEGDGGSEQDSDGDADEFLGFGYDTKYTAEVALTSTGIIKCQDEASAKNMFIDVTIEGQHYAVMVDSVEEIETYEGTQQNTNAPCAFYRTPREPEAGMLSTAKLLRRLQEEVEVYIPRGADGSGNARTASASIIGTGVYLDLDGATNYNINFVGGIVENGMSVIGRTAGDISRLPNQCKHGYIVQVSNSANTESDNYYLKFLADNEVSGSGRWEECVKPNNFSRPSIAGTWTQSGVTVTVTAASHGLEIGDPVFLDFTSSTGTLPADGEYKVASLPSGGVFTVKIYTSATVTGTNNVTVSPDPMVVDWDVSTMPHGLLNMRTGNFQFRALSKDNNDNPDNFWIGRKVGDYKTNPFATIRDKNIRQIFFYRNRLGLIADEQIVMSRPSDYFNLFNVSALTVSDDNPIDISVSDNKPAYLKNTLPTQSGISLFGDNGQFLLHTESDVFAAKTARIKKMSTYQINSSIKPIDLGTSFLFTSNVSAFTRAYEARILDPNAPPSVLEQTTVVPEFIPKDITILKNSSSLGLVTFGKRGDTNLYHYKYFDMGDQGRAQGAWYSWTLNGTLQYCLYNGGTFLAVTKHGSEYHLNKHEYITEIDTTSYPVGGVIGDVGNPLKTTRSFEAHLDNMVVLSGSNIVYTAPNTGTVGGFTTVKNIGYTPSGDYYLMGVAGSGGAIGTVLKADSVNSNDSGSAVFNNINMTGWTVAVGYKYTTTVELPTYYVGSGQPGQYDINGTLKISGINFELGVSGPMEFEITSPYSYTSSSGTVKDIDDFTHYESGNVLGITKLGSAPTELSKSVRVPIYRKNDKYNLTVKFPDPYYTALLSASWDGVYNQRRHARK